MTKEVRGRELVGSDGVDGGEEGDGDGRREERQKKDKFRTADERDANSKGGWRRREKKESQSSRERKDEEIVVGTIWTVLEYGFNTGERETRRGEVGW